MVVVVRDRLSVARVRVLGPPAVAAVLVALACSPSIAAAAPAMQAPLGWGQIPPGSTGGSETLASAVACPSTSQCTVVDTQGQQVTFNPTEPGHPFATTIDLDNALAGVACPSSSPCTAVDNQGQQVTFAPIEPPAALEAPATPIVEPNRPARLRPNCKSLSGCLADELASRLTFDGQLITLRAPSTSTCVAPGGRLAIALGSEPIAKRGPLFAGIDPML